MRFQRLKISHRFKNDYRSAGGRPETLRRWVCYLPDGVVRVLAGHEPSGAGGAMVGHVSVSVSATPDAGETPIRRPRDEEALAALELVPTDRKWEEYPSETLVRHWFDG